MCAITGMVPTAAAELVLQPIWRVSLPNRDHPDRVPRMELIDVLPVCPQVRLGAVEYE